MKEVTFFLIAFIGYYIIAPFTILYIFIKKGGDLKYLLKVAHGLDQAGASVLYKNNDTDISGNIGFKIKNGTENRVERWLGSLLDWIDPGHCEKSIEKDEKY